jgi:YesN/AraC family two-component response regulator
MSQHTLFPHDLVEDHYIPQPYAYYFRQWSKFQMPFHQHLTMEIMYMIQGTCQIEFQEPGQSLQTISLKKGEFVILDANIPHRLLVYSSENCQMLNVEFSFVKQPDMYPTTIQLMHEEPSLRELWLFHKKMMKLFDPDEMYYVMKSLVLELDIPHPNRLMIHMLFSQLMIRIARIYKNRSLNQESPTSAYIQEAMKFMQQQLEQDIHVQDVATHVNLHPTYLQRLFKQQLQFTMMEYLTMLRMEKAKKLLLHTQIPIIDISSYVGISSRQYFHYLFKKVTSMTPLVYRQSMHSHRTVDNWKVGISDNLIDMK